MGELFPFTHWSISVFVSVVSRILQYLAFGMRAVLLSSMKKTKKKEIVFFFLIFIVIQLQLCAFSPHPSTPPQLNPPPSPTSTLPPQFCPFVLYNSSCNPLFPLSPPHSPLATARLFPTSMSLVVFCLLFSSIDYVPVKGEIIWYLSLTAWLISLSIMLSSFIHAVAKGISSFFLSAA